VERDFSWSDRPGYLRLDYSQTGREVNHSLFPVAYSDVIRALGAHLNVTLKDNLRMGLFGQNLLNNQGFVNTFSEVGIGVRSRPRTFGVEFSATFD